MYQKNKVLKKLNTYKKILVTGGCGFIGTSLIKRLLLETNSYVYNIDKINYASDETCINLSCLLDLGNCRARPVTLP